jgi:hypothetical protein
MVPLRKARAGGTSLGYDWPEDGAVVEVPDDVAVALLGIKDGGFSVAPEQPAPTPDPDPPVDPDPPAPVIEPDPQDGEITEPDPGPDEPVVETKPAVRKTAARRISPKA